MKKLLQMLSAKNATFLTVFGLTMLVYWPGLGGSFVLDDNTSIIRMYVKDHDWYTLLYTITHDSSGLFGRSISILSFMLTEWQYGLDPWGFKFHNLLLHLANGLLIYRFLIALLPLLQPNTREPDAAISAAITTSFWLLHPLLVSTVLYAVQRMVELSVFFSLLALLSYLRARTQNSANRTFILYGWIFFPLCVLLAVLAKEIGVLVVVYVLIIEFLAFRTSFRSLANNRHVLYWLMFFVIIPMIVGGLYLLANFDKLANYNARNFTLDERLLTQLHVVASYIRAILLPKVSEMSLFHDFSVTRDMDVITLLLLGGLVLMLAAIWCLRHRAPVIAFGIAWFLGSHLLESTFLPLEMVFEHRNYLGAMGLLLPPIYYAARIQRKDLQKLRWFIVVFFLVLVGQTFSRVKEWSNTGTMLTVAINDHPNSLRARTEYANWMYVQGRMEENLEQLKITMEIEPTDAGAVVHQLLLYCLDGQRNEDLLIESERRLQTWPLSAYALNGLNRLLLHVVQGECKELKLREVELLIEAALSQPGNLKHPNNHGSLLGFLGLSKMIRKEYETGVDLFLQNYDLSGNILVLSQLAKYQLQFQHPEDAEQTIARIEQINRQRLGTETYLVRQLRDLLETYRKTSILSSSPQ